MGVRVDGDSLTVDSVDADEFGRSVSALAQEESVTLREVTPLDDDLESVFRYIVENR